MTIADQVSELAAQHDVVVDKENYANWLADAVNKIEGIEGDETLDLIVELMKRDILDEETGCQMAIQHSREIRGVSLLSSETKHGLGPIRG